MIKTDDSVKMVKHVYAMAMKFSIHSLWWDIVEGNGIVAQSTKAIILPEILDMLLWITVKGLLAPQNGALRRGAYRDFQSIPYPYPSTWAWPWAFKPVYTKVFRPVSGSMWQTATAVYGKVDHGRSRRRWTTMNNNGQQWTTMDNNGQQWTAMDNITRCYMHLMQFFFITF